MRYKILQLPIESDKVFSHYTGKVDLSEYKEVYEGVISNDYAMLYALEILYEKFNIHKPADYKARSLSVSDVIKLNDSYWYCDSCSWKKIC